MSDTSSIASSDPKCETILIVDDNSSVREALVTKLRESGFETVGARNGREAIALLPTLKTPTLIFLDLMMPSIDGWKLLDIWKPDTRFQKNKVVLISAVNPNTRHDKKLPADVVGSIAKPLSVKAVMAFVKSLCIPAKANPNLRETNLHL